MNTSVAIEIDTQKAPCAWFAIEDRKAHDEVNQVFWTTSQKDEMEKLRNIFIRVYGEDNVVMNINKTFFTFKVFKPSKCKGYALNMLIAMIEEMSCKPYRFRFNPRNEALYNVYPK